MSGVQSTKRLSKNLKSLFVGILQYLLLTDGIEEFCGLLDASSTHIRSEGVVILRQGGGLCYSIEFGVEIHYHQVRIGVKRMILITRARRFKEEKRASRKDTWSPVLWAEIGESRLIGPELVQETTDKIILIKEKLKSVRDRQKSYDDNRSKPLEVKFWDEISLRRGYCDNRDLSRINEDFVKRLRSTYTFPYIFFISDHYIEPTEFEIQEMVIVVPTGLKRYKDPETRLRIKQTNRKCRIPIDLYPCRVEEKLIMRKSEGKWIMKKEMRMISKDGTIYEFPRYTSSKEEEEEEEKEEEEEEEKEESEKKGSKEASEMGSNSESSGYAASDNEVESDLESRARSEPKCKEMEDTCESGVRPKPDSS
ncbi:hypothetical protein Tco_0839134 [Tanacetum coccineum]|uniref:Protein TIC 214 n=1 Tax=Tanacetum coccineum TaxID=301880 RepID=A0ABQ5ASK9_9ASTR